jgi:thioredoxin 1
MTSTFFFDRIAAILFVATPLLALSAGCAPSGKSSRVISSETMNQFSLLQDVSARKRSPRPDEQEPAPIVAAGQLARSNKAISASSGDHRVDSAPRSLDLQPAVSPSAVQQVAQRRPTVGKVSSATFQQEVLQSEVPVLVDFYADWCGPCKKLAPVLDQVAGDTPAAKIVKVNIDENPGLASQYKVRSVPTLMVFKGGRLVDQHRGFADQTKLQKMIQ